MARNLFAIRRSLFASLLAFAATAVAPAQAQDWPQRPVKLLVPFAAGGNIDVMGRLAAQRLSEGKLTAEVLSSDYCCSNYRPIALGVDASDLLPKLDPQELQPGPAGHDTEDGRLPRSRRPDERDRLGRLDRQVGRRAEGAKSVSESDPERHRVKSFTDRRTSALITIRSALIARATSRSMSSCS